ncbi:hypothetical protein ACPA9J_23465 [Pseudomonas aeruginosa]
MKRQVNPKRRQRDRGPPQITDGASCMIVMSAARPGPGHPADGGDLLRAGGRGGCQTRRS